MKPLNNNVLVEIIRDDDGVSRTDANESLRKGRLIDASVSSYHLTASAAVQFDPAWAADTLKALKSMKGKIVRWEEFAEGGQTFEQDGKVYALIPFWRLIGFGGEK